MNSKLDKLTGSGTGITRYGDQYVISGNVDLLKSHIRQAVAEDMLELVGEDEKNPGIRKHIFAETFQGKRNKLRAELRQKIKEYGGLK